MNISITWRLLYEKNSFSLILALTVAAFTATLAFAHGYVAVRWTDVSRIPDTFI